MIDEIFTAYEVCKMIGIPYWRLHYAEINERLPFKARRFRNGKRYFTLEEIEVLMRFFALSGENKDELSIPT